MRSYTSTVCLYAFVTLVSRCEASFVSLGSQPRRPPQQQQHLPQRSLQRRCSTVRAEAGGLKKVVVTGLGTFTSLGNDVDTFFNNLLDGKCGIAPTTRFDAAESAVKISSEVDFDIADFWEPKTAKRYDRYTHLAMAAAKGALEDGSLSAEDIDSFRFGVLIGSAIGGLEAVETSVSTLDNKGAKRISPFLLPSIIGNTAGSMVAIELGAKGPNYAIVSESATGTNALGEALKYLQMGEADVMLAGGTEAAITPLGLAGYHSMRELTTAGNDSPQTASRPFSADRAGFVMGEGAGVLLLETEEHALKRGAKIYAELAGYSATCDGQHASAEGEGMAACLRLAMENAGVAPSDVQYINANGMASIAADKAETSAIKHAFGEHAAKLKVSSTKGATGHLLGAAGGIEAAVCCKVMESGAIPPTINLDKPDPECDLDFVPNSKFVSEVPLDVVVSDSVGFGGHNAAVVFKRYTKA